MQKDDKKVVKAGKYRCGACERVFDSVGEWEKHAKRCGLVVSYRRTFMKK